VSKIDRFIGGRSGLEPSLFSGSLAPHFYISKFA